MNVSFTGRLKYRKAKVEEFNMMLSNLISVKTSKGSSV
jgi:hypothetical protein